MKLRLASAAVGIPIVLLAILGGLPGISTIAAVAAATAGYEIAGMARSVTRKKLAYIALTSFIVYAGISRATTDSPAPTVALSAIAAALLALTAFWNDRPGVPRDAQATRRARHLLAAVYFGVALAHAPLLAAEDDGRRWLLLAILATFAVDTGAYLSGRAIGRHRLAPAISPGKTWEGVFGGLAAVVGGVIALVAILDLPVAAWQSALFGLALATSAVSGDLYESWLKRRAGVKDSGSLVPGHGGILDRIDSLAPNLAVVYWGVQLLEL